MHGCSLAVGVIHLLEVVQDGLVSSSCHCLLTLYHLVDHPTDGCLQPAWLKGSGPSDKTILGGGRGGVIYIQSGGLYF